MSDDGIDGIEWVDEPPITRRRFVDDENYDKLVAALDANPGKHGLVVKDRPDSEANSMARRLRRDNFEVTTREGSAKGLRNVWASSPPADYVVNTSKDIPDEGLDADDPARDE